MTNLFFLFPPTNPTRLSTGGSNRALVEIENAKEVAAFLQSLAQSIEDSRLGVNSLR